MPGLGCNAARTAAGRRGSKGPEVGEKNPAAAAAAAAATMRRDWCVVERLRTMPVAHVVPAIQMDDGQTDDSGAAAIPPLPCQAACVRTRKGKVGRPLRGTPAIHCMRACIVCIECRHGQRGGQAVSSLAVGPLDCVCARRVMAPYLGVLLLCLLSLGASEHSSRQATSLACACASSPICVDPS